MIREKRRHQVPQLNTTSTADISFMLLTFFLMTTSMDSDKGLPRQLPPIDDEKQQEQTQDVRKQDLMDIRLNPDNTLTINDKPMKMSQLRGEVEKFVKGKCEAKSNHVISIEADRKANYETYFAMQNEIMLAYGSLRNQLAKSRFGKPFKELSPKQADEVRKYYPQRISEQL